MSAPALAQNKHEVGATISSNSPPSRQYLALLQFGFEGSAWASRITSTRLAKISTQARLPGGSSQHSAVRREGNVACVHFDPWLPLFRGGSALTSHVQSKQQVQRAATARQSRNLSPCSCHCTSIAGPPVDPLPHRLFFATGVSAVPKRDSKGCPPSSIEAKRSKGRKTSRRPSVKTKPAAESGVDTRSSVWLTLAPVFSITQQVPSGEPSALRSVGKIPKATGRLPLPRHRFRFFQGRLTDGSPETHELRSADVQRQIPLQTHSRQHHSWSLASDEKGRLLRTSNGSTDGGQPDPDILPKQPQRDLVMPNGVCFVCFCSALRQTSWQHCVDCNTTSVRPPKLGATPASQVSGGQIPPSTKQRKQASLKQGRVSPRLPTLAAHETPRTATVGQPRKTHSSPFGTNKIFECAPFTDAERILLSPPRWGA